MEFNFKITYRPGREGKKLDTLTRLAQDRPKRFDNSLQQHQFQTRLKAKHLDDNIKKALAVVFCANEANKATKANKANKIDEVDEVDEVDKVDEIDKVENKDIVDVRDYINQNLHQHLELEQILEQGFSSTKMAGSRIENSLEDLLDRAYQNDKVLDSIIAAK